MNVLQLQQRKKDHLNSQYSKIPMAASVIGIPRPVLSVLSVRCSKMWLFVVFIFVLINDSKSRKQAFRGGAKDHWPHTVFEEDEKSTSDSSSASSSSPKPARAEKLRMMFLRLFSVQMNRKAGLIWMKVIPVGDMMKMGGTNRSRNRCSAAPRPRRACRCWSRSYPHSPVVDVRCWRF